VNPNKFEQFEVLDRYRDVAPFLPQMIEAADLNRNALGFFAESVYLEYAQKDRLLILIQNIENTKVYAGHLLYSLRYPRASVRQMYTQPALRRKGCAERLLNHLVNTLTKGSFISIYARVGEDMVESNQFWNKQHFYVQDIQPGGKTRNRKIIVRIRELPSPQLFPSSGISSHNPLGLPATAPDIPLFLLDLNVLFDLRPRRARNSDAISLFRAQQMNFCRLAISTEISEELRRTAHEGKTDPMEAFTNTFPVFPLLKENKDFLNELAELIFPERHEKGKLTANDRSDLQHVAIAIQNDLAGLITNDTAILGAAVQLETKYGVEIISPAAFKLDGAQTSSSGEFETNADSTLTLLPINKSHEIAVHTLLAMLRLSGSAIANGWLSVDGPNPISRSCGVFHADIMIGYACWAAKAGAGPMTIRIAIDEGNPQALNAARILFIYLLKELAAKEPQYVRLELPPNQHHTRELAASFGFRATTTDQQCLSKIILGRVMTSQTWGTAQKALATQYNLKLPPIIPVYSSANQQIRIFTPDGNQTYVTLETLETSLSPALLCLPGRPAVITPIQKDYATHLIGGCAQASLLPNTTSSLYHDRHYLSGSKNLRHFKKGTIILFYESLKNKGQAAIIAIARVQEAWLKQADTLNADDLEQSVLTEKSIQKIGKSKMKTVTVFDNIFLLPHPVPLASLRKLGCGESHQLLSTSPILDSQLQAILAEGFNHA
jgi:GNAT superfamily N-acetyltransferase